MLQGLLLKGDGRLAGASGKVLVLRAKQAGFIPPGRPFHLPYLRSLLLLPFFI
jgi:hypothetical protein